MQQPARNLASLNDADLVENARRGDHDAFREIMTRHNQRLYRLARMLLKDDAEAEEAVQEAYLRAFTGLAGFRGEAALTTWLTRIVLNEALGRKRRKRPTVELEVVETLQQQKAQIISFPTADSDPERHAAQREIRRLIERAIESLPEPFRLVFVMRDVEEMSIEETAAFLNIRPETVKTRLHRARRLMRQALDQRLASALKDTFPFAGLRCARITEQVLRRLAGITPPAPYRGTSEPQP